jgi:hypothetical protein
MFLTVNWGALTTVLVLRKTPRSALVLIPIAGEPLPEITIDAPVTTLKVVEPVPLKTICPIFSVFAIGVTVLLLFPTKFAVSAAVGLTAVPDTKFQLVA